MNFRFAEFELRIEWVTPCDIEILHNGPVLAVPVEVFGDEPSVSDIHLDDGNILIDDFDGRVTREFECTCFVPELVDLVESIAHGHAWAGRVVML